MKKKDIFFTLLKAAVAMTLFVLAIVNYDTLSTLDVRELVSFTQETGVMIAVILCVYTVKALLFVVPASLIYVAVGAILPTWLAVAVNLVGIFIEVTVTYALGRFLGKDAVYKLLSKNEKGKKLLEKAPGNKAGVILTVRALPVFPIDLLSLFYGASGCPYLKYAALSVLGISPRVILFTIIGDKAFAWIPTDKIILAVIICIPIGVAVYLVKKFVLDPKKAAKKTQKQADGTEEEAS